MYKATLYATLFVIAFIRCDSSTERASKKILITNKETVKPISKEINVIAVNSKTAKSSVEKTLNINKQPSGKIKSDRGNILRNEQGGYNVKNSLPTNYVTNGTIDYTEYVQKALSTHKVLIFPAFPIQVNDNGLKILSNTTITFLKGSIIVLKPSAKSAYSILQITNVSDVTLNNPVIKGDRSIHLGSDGEWGMGLDIRSSHNIIINSPKVTDCWGDGIYLGQLQAPNSNIVINFAYCKNNRRNGISIISANGLKLVSPYASYSNGTLPMAGIDIEPNSSLNELKDISIINAITENNKGNGLDIVLNNLYGGGDKEVSISIINPKDDASVSGVRVISYRGRKGISGNIKGLISISKPIWSNSRKSLIDTSSMLERAVKLKLN